MILKCHPTGCIVTGREEKKPSDYIVENLDRTLTHQLSEGQSDFLGLQMKSPRKETPLDAVFWARKHHLNLP